ncbi:MAG: hypothetical protein KBA33_08120 [Cloacibacterium sp.]|nr:hypothetical protein [Cloacibacterium sp.]
MQKSKIFLTVISICIALVLLVSCHGRKHSEPVVITKEITREIVKRDTIIKIEKDSSKTVVKIDCPDGGTPVIKTIYKTIPGQKLQPPSLKLNGNVLTAECQRQADSLAIELATKYVREFVSEQKPIYIDKPVYIEKPLKWYVKFLMWIGIFSLIILAIGLILKIKR